MSNYPKENMTSTYVGEYRVRVWTGFMPDFNHDELKHKIWAVLMNNRGITDADLATEISSWPNVKAVEVVRGVSDGVVFYPEWP